EGLPFHQLRLDELFRWNAAGLARGPAGDGVLSAGKRPRVNIRRRPRAGEVEREQSLLRIAMKLDAGHDGGGQWWIERRFFFRAGFCRSSSGRHLHQVKRAKAIFVESEGDLLPV